MHNCLAIDVAKGKSMVTLVSSSGEILIDPYEVNHSINDFTNLLNRINKFKLDNIFVIMESTGVYHRPIERFFLENGFKVFVINPIYGKMKKRNLRKTKTDKEDCFNLVNLFMSNTFKEYIKPDQLYLDLNALSRQYFALDELCVNIKNRYRNLLYLCFPEYEEIFKGNMVYSSIALEFIESYPHADIISNARIDKLQNFFKKREYKSWKSKPIKIKEIALKSYPSVNMNDELVSNLSQMARLVNEYQKAIDIIKYKITFLAKKSKYFEPINSIYGIGEFTTSIIIAELGDTPSTRQAPVMILVSVTNSNEMKILDAGLATQSMQIAARALGYATKIETTAARTIRNDHSGKWTELLTIPSDKACRAALFIGYADESADAVSSASNGMISTR